MELVKVCERIRKCKAFEKVKDFQEYLGKIGIFFLFMVLSGICEK
jgi:hypothetical protein